MKYSNLILLYCGIIGPTLFFLLMYAIFPFAYPGFDSFSQHISQLGAVDSPVRQYANYLGFLVLGVLLILFSCGVRRVMSHDWYSRAFSGLLLLAGIIIVSISFLPCDIQCQNVTAIGTAHNLLSNLQVSVLSLAILFFLLSNRHAVSTSDLMVRTFTIIWATSVILWLCIILNIFSFELHGLYQRIILAVQYLGIVLISIRLINLQKLE